MCCERRLHYSTTRASHRVGHCSDLARRPRRTFVDNPLKPKARSWSAHETRSPVAREVRRATKLRHNGHIRRSRYIGPNVRKKAWTSGPGPFGFADLQHSSAHPFKRATRTGEPARRREELIKIPTARAVDAAWRTRRAARPRKIRRAAPNAFEEILPSPAPLCGKEDRTRTDETCCSSAAALVYSQIQPRDLRPVTFLPAAATDRTAFTSHVDLAAYGSCPIVYRTNGTHRSVDPLALPDVARQQDVLGESVQSPQSSQRWSARGKTAIIQEQTECRKHHCYIPETRRIAV